MLVSTAHVSWCKFSEGHVSGLNKHRKRERSSSMLAQSSRARKVYSRKKVSNLVFYAKSTIGHIRAIYM